VIIRCAESKQVHRNRLYYLFKMSPGMKNVDIVWTSQNAVTENFPGPLKISKFGFQTGKRKPTVIQHINGKVVRWPE
jgi:hypothetical protein